MSAEEQKDRLMIMPAEGIEKFFRSMRSHMESCTFTPDQFWAANHIIHQIDYVLDGNEFQKGIQDEIRPDNFGTTRDRKDNDASEDR
jgi:hypothetical protein|tara:strand:+ start:2905 stop:3165 length:261 start_codon:yes stop_codon:yes gene_type:complete